jgi:hypothetical protein
MRVRIGRSLFELPERLGVPAIYPNRLTAASSGHQPASLAAGTKPTFASNVPCYDENPWPSPTASFEKGTRKMTATESKDLKTGARIYWQGNVADAGTIIEKSWNAVTITWDNGHVNVVHHGDMREILRTPQTLPKLDR